MLGQLDRRQVANPRDSIGLKAENYLLTCRVDSISSPSKSAPRIFQTSPEHPNARIIITPPYHSKPRQVSVPGDIFDPQPPSKARQRAATVTTTETDNGRRTSGRKRTLTKYDDGDSSESDSMEEYSRRRKVQKTEKDQAANASSSSAAAGGVTGTDGPRRRKSSSKLLEATEGTGSVTTPTKRNKEDKEKGTNKTPNSNKPPREKEARLDRRENEELYESLQKQVTIELLKRRYQPFLPTSLFLSYIVVLTVEGEFQHQNKNKWLSIFANNYPSKQIQI